MDSELFLPAIRAALKQTDEYRSALELDVGRAWLAEVSQLIAYDLVAWMESQLENLEHERLSAIDLMGSDGPIPDPAWLRKPRVSV